MEIHPLKSPISKGVVATGAHALRAGPAGGTQETWPPDARSGHGEQAVEGQQGAPGTPTSGCGQNGRQAL